MDINGFGILAAIVAPTITCGVSSTVHYDILGLTSMSNILIGLLLGLLSSFAYLFFLWKYMKDDYDNNLVFTFGFITIFSFSVGFGIGSLVQTGWYWISLFLYIIAFGFLVRRNEIKLYEAIEASTPGFIILNLIIFLAMYFSSQNIYFLILSAISLVLLIVFFLLKKNYKKFTFYKSGKLGFASMVTLGMFFLFVAIFCIIYRDFISHAKVFGFLPSAILSFLSFFSLYNLSER